MTESSDSVVSRRHILTLLAAGAAMAAGGGMLAACGKRKDSDSGTTSQDKLKEILPAFVPNTSIKADIPSVTGANGAMSDPCFLKYPSSPVRTVTGAVGSGGSYVGMTPLWGAIPPSSGNAYYEAVNQAIGATLKMQPADGNTYDTQLPPLFAADKLPDWLQIPGWWASKLSLGQGVSKFTDLTPFLSGDKIKKYPNLAAIPQVAWACGVWNGKLYGIPCYSSAATFTGAIFYRKDIFAKKGINPAIKSIDELFNLGQALTDANAGVWAFDDLWTYLADPFGIPYKWAEQDGKIIHKYETEAMLEALAWQQKVVKAGLMHPDAVAGNTQNAKQRFWSGKVVISGDGTGSWNGDDWKSGTAANSDYFRQAFDPFTASGSGTPALTLGNAAGLFSYLSGKLSQEQVEECLAIANYLAAPYGSAEWLVANFGTEGVDYTMTDGNPVLTEQGNKEVATTFQFLASPSSATTVTSGAVDVAKAYAEWQAKAVKAAYKPLFYGMNITEPAQYGSIDQPVEDMLKDVRYGRKTLDDFKAVVVTWRTQGGDELRKVHEQVREENGTGQ
ncbi:MAG: hypothetical protein JXA67_02490 [Micromonosporaceae bacterium]|nr:hypothetical protein [Micromonosporaceae bacterium]